MEIPLIQQLKNFFIVKKLNSLLKNITQGYDLKKTITVIMFVAMSYILVIPLIKLILNMFGKNKKEKSSSHRVYNKLSSSGCSSSCSSSCDSSCDSSYTCDSSYKSSHKKKCKKNKCRKIKLSKEDVKKTLRNYKLT